MKQLDNYIIEKLHLNKGINSDTILSTQDWIEHIKSLGGEVYVEKNVSGINKIFIWLKSSKELVGKKFYIAKEIHDKLTYPYCNGGLEGRLDRKGDMNMYFLPETTAESIKNGEIVFAKGEKKDVLIKIDDYKFSTLNGNKYKFELTTDNAKKIIEILESLK